MKRKTLAYLAVPFVLAQLPSPLHAQDPEADSLSLFADELTGQAIALWQEGAFGDIEDLLLEALRIREQVFGENSLEVSGSLADLGYIYSDLGRWVEAEASLREAQDVFEALSDDDRMASTSMTVRTGTSAANNMNSLGVLFGAQRRNEEAAVQYERALEIYETRNATEQPGYATVLANLGSTYVNLGREEEGIEVLQRSLAWKERRLGPNHPSVSFELTALSSLYDRRGRLEEADSFAARALSVTEAALGPDHPLVGEKLNSLG